jgi:nitrate reductase molybdenum cofactor assembly chaperone NarJ/NarW
MQTAITAASFGILENFGGILTYPGENYLRQVADCRDAAADIDKEAAHNLGSFSARVSGLALEEAQELYVQTFDLNPVCALEVGWQLYGDNYDRGNFLVRMRQELRLQGVPENRELPDHLSNVLPLLAHMDPSEARQLVLASVVPALKKMLTAFEGKENPYESVLRALTRVLESALSNPAEEANNV